MLKSHLQTYYTRRGHDRPKDPNGCDQIVPEKSFLRLIVFAALLGLSTIAPYSFAQAAAAGDCHIGLYKLADGELIDVGASDDNQLRWRALDGRTGALTVDSKGAWTSTYGWTGRPDGKIISFGECPSESINFSGIVGARVPLSSTETTFRASGVRLAGRLVMPAGSGRVPIVVLVHGSEHDSARVFNSLQRLLPAQGVGAFVYDKRGTGSSQGVYTQDFDLLAHDAVAAMHEARRLAGARAGRIGFQGGSEGGWVVPLAATIEPVDFVIISFGMAVSVIDEDQEAIALEMKLKGHTATETAKALSVGAAAEAVMASGFTSGISRFEALQARYHDEPWFKDLHGNFTFLLLNKNIDQLHALAKQVDWHTPFHYDPISTLRDLATPQLWVLGGMDIDAPSEETATRLRSLIAAGRPITLAIYPKAEHGMTEFEMTEEGQRVSTRFSAGYFRMLADFAKRGKLTPPYGKSIIFRHGGSSSPGMRDKANTDSAALTATTVDRPYGQPWR